MSDSSNGRVLDFEKPIHELEKQIDDLQKTADRPGIDISKEIKALQRKLNNLIKEVYGNLSSWDRVLLSRHPERPHSIDYINNLITDFHEVYGDRYFANDNSLITGFGYLEDQKVCVVAIEKGRKTKDKVFRNFGMPRPEGYRKAIRVMKMASRFKIPIITFVDTPGAYPGIGAEERGQSSAIAENLAEMFDIQAPIVTVIIGEGGSGGALGIAVADKVMMMEFSVYSVISPESCASILWTDPKKAEVAANSLKLGPVKAYELGIIDKIIQEPSGGAHRDPEATFENVKKALSKDIRSLLKHGTKKLLENRGEKFRAIGNQTIEGYDPTELEQFFT